MSRVMNQVVFEPLGLPEGWTLRLQAGDLTWAALAEGEGLRLSIDAQGAVRSLRDGQGR